MASLPSPEPIDPSDEEAEASAEALALWVEPMADGWIRVMVEGELALGSASNLERAVERELLAGRNVLLDFSQIAFIDSFGLRAMTGLVRTARGSACELKLGSDVPAHARRLMEIVGLLPFVPIDPSESELVDSESELVETD